MTPGSLRLPITSCVVVILAAASLGACGRAGQDDAQVMSDAPREAPAPEGSSNGPTAGGDAPLAEPIGSPGPDATLGVDVVPEGWVARPGLDTEAGPGAPVRFLFFTGPPSGRVGPGGAEGRRNVTINATYHDPLVADDQTAGVEPATDTSDDLSVIRDTSVGGRSAQLVTGPDGPDRYLAVIVSVGDWRVQVTGQDTDEATVLGFAEVVRLS